MIRTVLLAAALVASAPVLAHDRYYYGAPSVSVSTPSLSFSIGPTYERVYVPGPVYVAPPPPRVYYYPAPAWRYEDYRHDRHYRSHRHHDRYRD